MRFRLVACAALGVLGLAATGCQYNAATEHVVIQATTIDGQPAFSVPTINTVRDQRVVIELGNATDQPRGFAVDGYGIEKRIDPGRHVVVSFKADKAGIFRVHDQIDQSAQDSRLVVAEA